MRLFCVLFASLSTIIIHMYYLSFVTFLEQDKQPSSEDIHLGQHFLMGGGQTLSPSKPTLSPIYHLEAVCQQLINGLKTHQGYKTTCSYPNLLMSQNICIWIYTVGGTFTRSW